MRRPEDVARGSTTKRDMGGEDPPDKRASKRGHSEAESAEQAEARAEWEKDDWEDRIDWLADILGTMDLLELIIGAPAYDLDDESNRELKHQFQSLRTFKTRPPRVLNGIFFMKGHWYCCRDNIVSDSYHENFQIKGTAHFCQTFACMIFLRKTEDLSAKGGSAAYGENVRVALRFLRATLEENSDLANRLIREIRTSKWKNRWIPSSELAATFTQLKHINVRVLLSFLVLLENNATHLYKAKTT